MIKTSAILTAVALAFVAPSIASACIAPAGPPPTPEQREANLREIQAASWANAALVYEAEITESFMVFSQDDPIHPGMASGAYVRAKPVRVLKGEGTPLEVQFAYGLGPECTFGPSYSPRSRGKAAGSSSTPRARPSLRRTTSSPPCRLTPCSMQTRAPSWRRGGEFRLQNLISKVHLGPCGQGKASHEEQ